MQISYNKASDKYEIMQGSQVLFEFTDIDVALNFLLAECERNQKQARRWKSLCILSMPDKAFQEAEMLIEGD